MPGSIVPLPVMLEEEEDRKAYAALQPPKSVVVRYGALRMIAELSYDGDAKPGCGSKMVIRTRRGIELGEMLTTTCPNAGCGSSVSRKEMLQYIENSGGKEYPFTGQGRVLRVATIDDLHDQAKLDDKKPEIIRLAKSVIRELDLPMRLVDVELLLGGERVIFHYTSEQWVDFRELVKRLATEYQTRIEMNQVNARNEARLVADYEKCGQHCCCKQFLKVLKPVSMRSAKVQKATLDPTKISGRCGRLMCCLRYEDESYEDLRRRLPKKQTRVTTDDGPGTVVDSQILTQLVMVRLDSPPNKFSAYPLESIAILDKSNDPGPPPPAGASSTRRERTGGERPPRGGDRPERGERGGDRPERVERSPRRDGDSPEGKSRRSEPRRPRPGQPLADEAVESAEGESMEQGTEELQAQVGAPRVYDPDQDTDDANLDTSSAGESDDTSADEAGDNAPAGEGEAGEGQRKKRRRRRRRRGKGRGPGGGGGGEGGGGGGGGD